MSSDHVLVLMFYEDVLCFQQNIQLKTDGRGVGGPLRADHTLDALARSAAAAAAGGSGGRSDARRASSAESCVSSQGGSVGRKLKRCDREYTELMDRYRQLKQMKSTPERDQTISELLTVIRTWN